MGNLPKVSVAFSNGNLLQNIPAIDGYAALMGTGLTPANINKVFTVNSLLDAETQGITAVLEPVAHKHIAEFYTELAGNQKLYVLLTDEAVTMAQMLDANSISFANKIMMASNGDASIIGVFRTPPVAYAAGADFFDTDVQAALVAAKPLVKALNDKLMFTRILIAGRVAVETSTVIFAPKTLENDFAGVVLGDTVVGKNACVGVALGRKQAYACNIKVGKVANGALNVNSIFIGTKPLATVTNLDDLHGKGVISFLTYPNKAGFFFGIDNMANTRDYRLLVYGCTIDACAKVAASVYIDELEAEVDTNADGTILEIDAVHLEDRIKQQVAVTIGDRISGFDALVDRTINIINTGKTAIKLRARPKGYNTFIDIDLGLTGG